MRVIKTESFLKVSDRVEHPPVHPYKTRMTNIVQDDVPDEERVKRVWKKKPKKKDKTRNGNPDIIHR
jgi:hypothetical protein